MVIILPHGVLFFGSAEERIRETVSVYNGLTKPGTSSQSLRE